MTNITMMAWPEITSFHNIRKYTKSYPEILQGDSLVTYKAKVKLHGTNAAVQMIPSFGVGPGPGNIAELPLYFQSRENLITPEKDNAGFARWASEAFKERQKTYGGPGVIIFGEWIGPGIQKGVAVSEIPKKCFAVFAARPMLPSYIPDQLIVDPDKLQEIVAGVPDVYVLPWYKEDTLVDWSASSEMLSIRVDLINDWVHEVEANDPWVEATFGVKGTGEGLVFYPTSEKHLGFENFKNLVFKAKGEKHKNIKDAAPAQVDPSVASGIDAFVDMVLTEARLEQGTTKVSADGSTSYDLKLTGKFVAWVVGDVQKETAAELAASNLTWKQVQKPISDKARAWYMEKAKSL